MGWKSTLITPFANRTATKVKQWQAHGVDFQRRQFTKLMRGLAQTAFGNEHGITANTSIPAFQQRVPLRDYEELRPWVNRILEGESDVLWKGKPKYFAKTSGTTSGVKYIPITKDSVPNHFGTARDALFNYAALSGNKKWMDGKMIFLSGSPELETKAGIATGRLSGISNHMVPSWLKTNQLPSYATNCIEDWEIKVDKIVEETVGQDLRLISGIPPWVQMYYERLLDYTGKKTVKEVFPNFDVFVYGGVNYEPYRQQLEELVGAKIPSVETYPASEGFIAFQDRPNETGLLLNVDSGIFFEFVPLTEIGKENPQRLWLDQVEPGIDYAVIINNNAGLWGYNIGDTVRFLSVNPPRILVSGRIKHYISAFGEHVIGKEVDEAMIATSRHFGINIIEYTVAPQIKPTEGGAPYHEWFVEFEHPPTDLTAFAARLDQEMTQQNIYYQDLIAGGILQQLKITSLPTDAFRNYMKTQGKLGGQNKVPRLSNDREIVEKLKR